MTKRERRFPAPRRGRSLGGFIAIVSHVDDQSVIRTSGGGSDIAISLGGFKQFGNGHDKSLHTLQNYTY